MKKVISIILALLSVFIIKISVFATEEFQSEISDKLFSSLDDEFVYALEEFGITDLDYESIYNISLSSVLSYYRDTLKGLFLGTLRSFMKLFSIILIVGLISIILDSEKYKSLLHCFSVTVLTLIMTDDINICLNSAISLLKLNSNFMMSFVPVYAITIAVSGSPATALTYNSLILTLSECISAFINYGLVDLVGCFFCLSVALSINDTLNFGRLISFTNRFVSFGLGLLSSVFASILTLKGSISASADTIVSKGARFAIGSLIPVIGSSISEAYSVLLGSINVIKGSVAIIGIIAVLIVNLPVLVEIVLHFFSLSSLSYICEMLDCKNLSNVFTGFSCGIKIIGLLVVFEMFVFIISTAVMLSLKGG